MKGRASGDSGSNSGGESPGRGHKPRRDPSGLSAEDQEEWRRELMHVTPLVAAEGGAHNPEITIPEEARAGDVISSDIASPLSAPPASALPAVLAGMDVGGLFQGARPSATQAALPLRGKGDVSGIHGRMARRFRSGKLPVGAVLDLHGHTREEAFDALHGFLSRAQRAGKRKVLVITGRGRRSVGTEGDGGVLKRMVERWLAEPEARPLVLAYEQAKPYHGGDGALYVLLRRVRAEEGGLS